MTPHHLFAARPPEDARVEPADDPVIPRAVIHMAEFPQGKPAVIKRHFVENIRRAKLLELFERLRGELPKHVEVVVTDDRGRDISLGAAKAF